MEFQGGVFTAQGSFASPSSGPGIRALSLNGGTLNVLGAAGLDARSGAGGTLSIPGSLTVETMTLNGTAVDGTGTLTVNSALTVSATGTQSLSVKIANHGALAVTAGEVVLGSGSVHDPGSTMDVSNGAILTLSGTATSGVSGEPAVHELNGTSFTGAGSVIWDGVSFTGTSVSNAADLTWRNGTVALSGSFTNTPTGKFRPEASTPMALATFINNGVVSPGTSPGLFSITGTGSTGTGNFEQGATGKLFFELQSPATVGETYDALTTSGDMTLDGTIALAFLSGYTPSAGDTFDLLSSAGTTTGGIAALLPTLTPGTDGSLSTDSSGTVSLSFASTAPSPAPEPELAPEPAPAPAPAPEPANEAVVVEAQAETSAAIVSAVSETTGNLSSGEAASEEASEDASEEKASEEQESESKAESEDSEDGATKKTLECTA